MRALIFDLDDTLYNQLQPFQAAINQNFNLGRIHIESLYVLSRKYSDEVFHLSESGQIGMEEMHIYRIKQSLADFGICISNEEAKKFQQDYDYFQSQIYLLDDIRQTLDVCQNNGILMGLITNGPAEHQWKKIHQLRLNNWIKEEHMIVSGEVGLAKPQLEIFELAEKRMGLVKEETYYIGDSFQNDVVGAKKANWQAVWINRRQHQKPRGNLTYDYLVDGTHSLLQFIQSLE